MENKERTLTVAVITAVIALLLGCCLGAMAGALGGYVIGQQASRGAVERITPNLPNLPEIPDLPDLQGMQGAVVQEVIVGSPAEKAGVEVGDIITGVDGAPLDANHRLADVVAQYQPGDRIKLSIWRAGDAKRLMVTLGENPQDSSRPYLGVRYSDFADQPDNAAPDD
jgi:S1-C subfamily serine protease